jgi:hypothetical protein
LIGNSNSSNRDILFVPLPLILVSMVGGSLLSLGILAMGHGSVQGTVNHSGCDSSVAYSGSRYIHQFPLGTSQDPPQPHLLLVGVVAFLIAIALAMRAQLLYSASNSNTSTIPIPSAAQFESWERGIEIKPWRPARRTRLLSTLTSNQTENTSTKTTNETIMQLLKKGAVDVPVEQAQRVDQVIEPWLEKPTTTAAAAAAADSTISLSSWRQHSRRHQSYNSHHGDDHDDDHSCTITNNNTKTSLNNRNEEEEESNEKQDDQENTTVIGSQHESCHEYINSNNSIRGLIIATCGGLCFGFFSPAFNIAVNGYR